MIMARPEYVHTDIEIASIAIGQLTDVEEGLSVLTDDIEKSLLTLREIKNRLDREIRMSSKYWQDNVAREKPLEKKRYE